MDDMEEAFEVWAGVLQYKYGTKERRKTLPARGNNVYKMQHYSHFKDEEDMLKDK